jgi:hypothetical protein
MVAAATTTSPLPAATVKEAIPAGRVRTGRASPPSAGRLHRAGVGSPSSFAPGTGRAEVNSSEPSGAHIGEDSPGALRVSRRARRAPSGSTSQSADCHFFPSASSVCTEMASRRPSGERANAPTRGRATKAARSANGPLAGSAGAGAGWLTGAFSLARCRRSRSP